MKIEVMYTPTHIGAGPEFDVDASCDAFEALVTQELGAAYPDADVTVTRSGVGLAHVVVETQGFADTWVRAGALIWARVDDIMQARRYRRALPAGIVPAPAPVFDLLTWLTD